jgi:ADP-ribose pyrophosphatase YjhB (NUDIX family)
MDQYKDVDRLVVAVDSIIFGFDRENLKLLLIKRGFEPQKGKWSLMGGFLKRDESLNDAAKRVMYKLTGFKEVYLEQLYGFGKLNRDPVERTISIAFYALINTDKNDKELMERYDAQWFPINDYPDLIFDHNEMVEAAKARLKYKASHQPVGFELLPQRFTLPELQNLYEAIYQTPLDKRNFRRRILSTGVLKKTNEKQKQYSKKGAFLYEFDKEKYEEKRMNGANLVFKPTNNP